MLDILIGFTAALAAAAIIIGPRATLAALLCLAALFSGLARAEAYLTVGVGQAKLRDVGIQNLWMQEGFGKVAEEKSTVWTLGAGYRFTPWLAIEADYRDLGQFNSMAVFTPDGHGAPGAYNPQTGQCNGPCMPSSAGYQHGTTKGAGLSAVLTFPNGDLQPFVRAGAFYHVSKYYTAQFHATDPDGRYLVISHGDRTPGGFIPFEHRGLGWMWGAGLRWERLSLEYTYFPKAAGPTSPYRNIQALTLNWQFDL
jgi:hypothetical protein